MTTMTRRNSIPAELMTFRRLNHLLDDAFAAWPFASENGSTVTSAWYPPCDVFESREHLQIVAELPGLKPEDVRISLENNVLTLRGEKKQVAEEKTDRVHRYERSYGVFERTFALPNTIDGDRVEAQFADGVLTITLPKVERARPREIEVKVGR